MVEFFKKILRKYRWTSDILELYFLRRFYLTETGWLESRFRSRPMDRNRNPIPWLTYASIYFLNQVLSPELSLFEYGCGNSTIWFSERVGHVTSVEHDASYYELIKSSVGTLDNVDLIHFSSKDAYIQAIRSTGKKFDVVVVDGRERVECSKVAAECLTDGGVIIWDNSERDHYHTGVEYLLATGFKKIDFMSHVPIGHHQSCTTIFYKANNCFNI